MRKILCLLATGAVLAGPVAVAAAPVAGAAPGPASQPVRASASTTLLGARALTGLSRGHDALDVDVAVTHSTVDSTGPASRRASADAANFDIAAAGSSLPLPSRVSQQAPPVHPHASTAGLDLNHTALAPLVRADLLTGSAQARWSDTVGACVSQPLTRAATTAADLSLLAASMNGRIPYLPGFGRKALVSLPGTVRSTSQITLGSRPGHAGRSVVSTGTLRVADLRVFASTPAELDVRVLADPTLTAISTGDPATSTVTYRAPVLEVLHAGHRLGRLDARHPTLNLPLAPGLPPRLNLGAVRLALGQLDVKRHGASVTGRAALLDVQVLPTGRRSALAEVVVGDQAASAAAPAGGVMCGTPASPPPPPPAQPGAPGQPPAQPAPAPNPARQLANTNAAYNPLPYIAAGGALLLVGSVLLAAMPRRSRPRDLTM